MSKQTAVVHYEFVNGLFSLNLLEPIFIHFPKSDISGIKQLSKEEFERTWGQTGIKVIGSQPKNNNKSKIMFNFLRNTFFTKENIGNNGWMQATRISLG